MDFIVFLISVLVLYMIFKSKNISISQEEKDYTTYIHKYKSSKKKKEKQKLKDDVEEVHSVLEGFELEDEKSRKSPSISIDFTPESIIKGIIFKEILDRKKFD